MTDKDKVRLEFMLETITNAARDIEKQSRGQINTQAGRILLQVEDVQALLRTHGILPKSE